VPRAEHRQHGERRRCHRDTAAAAPLTPRHSQLIISSPTLDHSASASCSHSQCNSWVVVKLASC
jgi:hypothetical protein